MTADMSAPAPPAGERPDPERFADLVAEAMQSAFDDFVGDTGCMPECFAVSRGPKLSADFSRGNYKRMVGSRLIATHIAERAAGWNAARDAAVAAADAERREWMQAKDSSVALGCSFTWKRIRDLPLPPADADALARVVAEARREVWAKAVEIARHVPIPGDCGAVEAHGRMVGALAAAEALSSAAASEGGGDGAA